MNTHEANRAAMAEAMSTRLWRDMAPGQRTHAFVERLHDMDDGYRLLVAECAGRNRVPSEETWNLMLSLLHARVDGWNEASAA